ncbi:putative hemolysin [Hasllibacter halocynthiae]|uniref:Putative hemolysin n=1 Tax=Hasllibacter halocynthiae TaxID=595589 RepID=A0A2T0X9F6_9RHOB|nr:1-acyl-sn-glycerol-3-phosphate acyltransferase [Hasllibacter halocynthiae]PRY95553.1 putative hemolysin [Hasllibacter halocynthiae]
MSETIRERLDPLILERAPWLRRRIAAAPRWVLDRMLGYHHALEVGAEMDPLPGPEIMARVGERLAKRVEVHGLGHVPAEGPVMLVANHPTGIGDGVILHRLLAPTRPDLYFMANADILRVLPQLAHMIVPVEWREDRRSRASARQTLLDLKKACEGGRLGIVFPSGRLAERRGLTLHERPWMHSAAAMARKFDMPVVPVHVTARNSALFYALDAAHPTLRDVTLFHETLNKDRQRYRVAFGPPVLQRDLPASPEEATRILREGVLALAPPHVPLGSRWMPDFRRASFPLRA